MESVHIIGDKLHEEKSNYKTALKKSQHFELQSCHFLTKCVTCCLIMKKMSLHYHKNQPLHASFHSHDRSEEKHDFKGPHQPILTSQH